jgi:DNA-binding NarL/FixJ family response regulator
MIRLLIADDHNLFREGIKKLIEDEKDITIVGEAEDGISLITKFKELKPDVILTDISMPGKNGPDAIKIIKKNDKEVGVLFLSQFTGDDYIYLILNANGDGLLSKNVMKQELILAIRTIAKGGRYFGVKTEDELSSIVKRYTTMKRKGIGKSGDSLTSKEKEILLFISKGKKSKEIAELLHLSTRTIESHRSKIIRKMGLTSFPELVRFSLDYARAEEEEINNL